MCLKIDTILIIMHPSSVSIFHNNMPNVRWKSITKCLNQIALTEMT